MRAGHGRVACCELQVAARFRHTAAPPGPESEIGLKSDFYIVEVFSWARNPVLRSTGPR